MQICEITPMKLALFLLSLFVLNRGFAETAPSLSQKTGVGLIFGEPTAASLKYWKSKDRAIDAGLGFSFDDYIIFSSNYLIQLTPYKNFLPYAGIGGEVMFTTDSRRDGPNYGRRKNRYYNRDDRSDSVLGIRIPVGVEWPIPNYPIGLLAELAPGMGIIPEVFGFIQGGVGGRYYF